MHRRWARASGACGIFCWIISYNGCTKQIVTYDESGEIKRQEPVYEDGTGTVVFHGDGTFTWHEDQSEYGTDLLFEWVPASD